MMQQDHKADIELPTLEEVRVLFQEWRDSRPKGTGLIPEYIWSQVAQLIGRYSQSDITKRLGINSVQIKSSLRYKSSPGVQSSHSTLENSFIKVAMPQGSLLSEPLPLSPMTAPSELDHPKSQGQTTPHKAP